MHFHFGLSIAPQNRRRNVDAKHASKFSGFALWRRCGLRMLPACAWSRSLALVQISAQELIRESAFDFFLFSPVPHFDLKCSSRLSCAAARKALGQGSPLAVSILQLKFVCCPIFHTKIFPTPGALIWSSSFCWIHFSLPLGFFFQLKYSVHTASFCPLHRQCAVFL
jgi:hypothetical protein